MRPPGSYKFASRNRSFEAFEDPALRSAHRARRIAESIRDEIVENDAFQQLRIRRVFSDPHEIFRLELELPELGYQRTTLLDREALEVLLEADGIRAAVARRVSLA